MTERELAEFLAALRAMDAEYLASPEKARELLESEGAIERYDTPTGQEDGT